MAGTATMETDEHPLFARFWSVSQRRFQPKAVRERRAQLAEGLEGVVVEVGCGSGTAFAHYRAGVSQVIAVEPEPSLRREAEAAAERAPVPVDVRPGTAEALPVEAGSADAVVFSLVLCSVPDQAAALAEAARVLRPGGELRYFEHVAEPEGTRGRSWQRWLDRSGVWPKVGAGCHVSRDTGAAIRAAGFTVEREQDENLAPPLVPVRRHLLGRARRAG